MTDLASIAESQIGTQEDARHQNEGSAILKYQQATSLDAPSRSGTGWPWCAAFVDWCVEQYFLTLNSSFSLPRRPRSASAFGLVDWAREQDGRVLIFSPFNSAYDAQRNDIVVYTFSHCGIVSGVNNLGGGHSRDRFEAIEGNTNTDGSRDGYEVARKPNRIYSAVYRFIRLPL